MAKLKVDLETLLMKILNVFPKDIYILHNWCAIAGDESDGENRGFYLCILNEDVREMLNLTFPNNPTLYIKNLRDAKKDLSLVQEIIDEKIVNVIETKVDEFMTSFKSITSWDNFNFSEEDTLKIFKNGESFILFENDENKVPVIISKSLFPLITEKTINSVIYNCGKYNENNELNQITMVYDYELFQLVMRYLYLDI